MGEIVMNNKIEKRKKRVKRMAQLGRKYKAVRYLLIALLAVCIFCEHLVYNTSRRFKISVAIVLIVTLVGGLMVPVIRTSRKVATEGFSSIENMENEAVLSPVSYTLSCSTVEDTKIVTRLQLPIMNDEVSENHVEEAPLLSETMLTLTEKLPEGIVSETLETNLDTDEPPVIQDMENRAEDIVTDMDGEENTLSLSVSVSVNQVSEDEVLREGYEMAPSISLNLMNTGEETLHHIKAESEHFEMAESDGMEGLFKGEQKELQIRLKAGLSAGIYTDDMKIFAEDAEGSISVSVTYEVHREVTTLTVSAPEMEILVGDEIPVIAPGDYIVEGLRDEDTIDNIEGLVETHYNIENSDTVQTVSSEELDDLKLADYEIEFYPGTLRVEPRIPDESYLTVSGKKNQNGVYTGNITLSANGVDGFETVAFDQQGSFASSITISEDAVEQKIDLYFEKGNAVTEPLEFFYTKDTIAPVLTSTLLANEELDRKIICITGSENGIPVKIEETGTGVEMLHCIAANVTREIPVENSMTQVSVPDDFYGQVTIYGKDMGDHESNHFNGIYLKEQTAPAITFEDLGDDRILVTVKETGDIVSGIAEDACLINGEVFQPEERIIKEKTVLLDDLSVMTEYHYIVPVTDKDTIQVNAKDFVGNASIENYQYKKKTIDVTYPTYLDFAIDPEGTTKMGQVLSDDQRMVNNSNISIEIEIKDLYYTFADPEHCEARTQPVSENSEGNKKQFYLYWSRADVVSDNSCLDGYRAIYREYTKETQELPWGKQELKENPKAGEDDIVITDQHLEEPVVIRLEAGEMAMFRFFGSMTAEPAQTWIDKNVTVHVLYSMHPIDE